MEQKKLKLGESLKKGGGSIVRILWLLFFLVLLPPLALCVYNFFQLVVLGQLTLSEFKEAFPQYSYGPVLGFYDGIRQWLLSLVHRLKQ